MLRGYSGARNCIFNNVVDLFVFFLKRDREGLLHKFLFNDMVKVLD
jgi:hypothetical protein